MHAQNGLDQNLPISTYKIEVRNYLS